MLNRNADVFIGCDSEYNNADIVMFGAPFDSTTSYRPGSRFGSRAIRAESYGIETFSPYQDRDLSELRVFDAGDLELPFGNPEPALSLIEGITAEILNNGKLPLMIGGEHLVTLGAVSAVAKKYPDLHIIHFDAHADLRDDYLGQRLSHATVLHRAWDIVGDRKIHQFGIRSGDKSEFEFAKSHTFMQRFDFDGLDECVKSLRGKKVYFTLDLDVLDPSVFPGTGTPEAGGVSFIELLDAIKKVCGLDIAGCDITELAPNLDTSGASTAVACKLVREILLNFREK